jgi:hypothetical protein
MAQSRPCIINTGDIRPRPAFIGFALAADSKGNLFFVQQDTSVVRKLTPAGVVSAVAGTGTAGFSGDNGPATAAQLGAITDIAVDSAGNLYIAETVSPRIRKVTPDGIITTVAGNGMMYLSGDGGPATAASLCIPTSLAADGKGNLYISFGIPGTDSDGGSDFRVRRVDASGIISTYAGNGTLPRPSPSAPPVGNGVPATSTTVYAPNLAADSSGNLYVLDGARVRRVTPAGIIATVVGTGVRGMSGEGGPAVAATVGLINQVDSDSRGNLYISDFTNNRIWKVNSAGTIATHAGDGAQTTAGQIRQPRGLAADAAGNVFVVTPGISDFQIRKITADGILSTVWATPAGRP